MISRWLWLHPTVVPEAELEQTEAGPVPAGVGWFVMNAREARWFHRPGHSEVAYGRFPPSQPTRYRDGLLPVAASASRSET